MNQRWCALLTGALAVLCWAAPAAAQGRMVALVSPVEIDGTLAGHLPQFYSPDIMRRELEIALEATGLFTVPTRERHDLDPVIREVIRTHRGSSRIVGARFILNPTIESITLDERRRRATNMAGKDLVSVTGTVALRLLVLDARTGAVETRMSVDVRYAGRDHLADPQDYDQLAGPRSAVHVQAGSPDFVLLAQATGRAFAKRVLDQVNPVLVAQTDANRVYLTRGEEAGYRIGETLRIIRRGVEIRNPATHEVIGRSEEQIGEVRIVEVQPRMSIAEVTRSTRPVLANDIVREPVEAEDE